ncbi:hypothetical protein IV203_009763 [Nitzschia inconspicua]|uniref:RNA-editing substrate-binding complex 6 protein domain-containing protein n=1 Tax=Nitzschia inconspicua TaxID=303405 RepID=A0A9K3KWF5_9STRA|nr:hypothetical protein IV203_009763 [Nitzschia inconspicua]
MRDLNGFRGGTASSAAKLWLIYIILTTSTTAAFVLHPSHSTTLLSPSNTRRTHNNNCIFNLQLKFGLSRNQQHQASSNQDRYYKPQGSSSAPKPPRSKNVAQVIEINKMIVALGKQRRWKDILILYQQEKTIFNNVNFATAITQIARIQSVQRSDPLFQTLMDDLSSRIEDNGIEWMGTREFANTIHALGKMKLKSISARKILNFATSSNIGKDFILQGNSQGLANIAWAFAKLDIKAPNFFNAIEEQAEWLVKDGSPQATANTAWAFAKLDIKAPNFFNAIEEQAEWLVKDGSPQATANTAWTFAKLDIKASNFFNAIEEQAEWLVKEGNSQTTANTAWAFAKLDIKAPNFFNAIDEQAEWLVKEGNSQNTANTAWAFAKLDTKAPNYFNAIEEQAE